MLPAPGQRNSATRTGRPGPTLIRRAGGSATRTSHTWPTPGGGNCHGYQPPAGPPASRNGRRATPGHATCRAVDPHRPDLGGGDPVRARAHPVADLHSAERPAGAGVVLGLRRPHAARRRDAVRRGRRRIAGRDPRCGPHVPAAPGGTPAPQRRGQRLSRAMTPNAIAVAVFVAFVVGGILGEVVPLWAVVLVVGAAAFGFPVRYPRVRGRGRTHRP